MGGTGTSAEEPRPGGRARARSWRRFSPRACARSATSSSPAALIAGHGEDARPTASGQLLTRAREEGEIPWEWIVQEGRAIERVPSWADPAAYARAVQASYRRNKWAGQPTRIIVVSEKGTVRGTLAPVLDEFEVDFLPVGGYASATRVYELAQLTRHGSRLLLLLYLGDHDPSRARHVGRGPPPAPGPLRERRPRGQGLDRRARSRWPWPTWGSRSGASPSPSRTPWRSAPTWGSRPATRRRTRATPGSSSSYGASVLGTGRDEPERPARARRGRDPRRAGPAPSGSATWPPSGPNGSRSRARSARGRVFPG